MDEFLDVRTPVCTQKVVALLQVVSSKNIITRIPTPFWENESQHVSTPL